MTRDTKRNWLLGTGLAAYALLIGGIGAILAAPPALTVDPAAPGKIAEVSAPVPLKWDVRGADARVARDGKSVVFVAPPKGQVVVVVAAPADPGKLGDVAVTTVGAADQAPKPQPQPQPQPEPKPEPRPEPAADRNVWVVVVEETSARTEAANAVLTDRALWDGLTAKGHKFRIYDKDEEPAKAKGYVRYADAVGLPALLILATEGGQKPLGVVALPATAADVTAAVKAAGGK